MYDKSQLNRGTLEGCILKIISLEETYGYFLLTRLSQYGFDNLKEGTIYPLLMRLEKKSLISSTYKPSPLGPKRKNYTITALGLEMLNEFESHWCQIALAVNTILDLEGDIT